jgi:hypothetical protein
LVFQLEDAEFAKIAALKSKQNLELELSDVQQQVPTLPVSNLSEKFFGHFFS